jgi:Rrf2 family protein
MFNRSMQHAINLLSVMPKVGETESAKNLAKAAKVPPAYATKVMQFLGAAKIVSSSRGVGGGVTLLKPANKITVAEVYDAVVGAEDPKKGSPAEKKTKEIRKVLEKMLIA